MAFTPDAQYLADAALRAFQRRQRLGELDRQSTQGTQDLHEAIRRLGEQRGVTLQNTKQTANSQGLLYSGQLGKRIGDVEKDSARQQGDLTRDEQRNQEAITAARNAINAGAPLEEASAAAAATDRQIQRDQDAADANALAVNPPPASPAAARAPKPAKPKASAKPRPPRPPRRPRAARVGRPSFGAGAATLTRRVAAQRQRQPRR